MRNSPKNVYQQFVNQVRKQCTLSEYCKWCQKNLGYSPNNYDCLVILSLFQHDRHFVYTYRSNEPNGVVHIFKRVIKRK